MNILIPDSWLRKFLKTKATPTQIKEYLSLCGPSVERIDEESGEPIYDIEITTNRPDAMSVFGIAREASVILPRFGIAATLLEDPYALQGSSLQSKVDPSKKLKLAISTDPVLNPRWTSVVLSDVKVTPSPEWLQDWLTKTGIRPINTIIDVTNYLMRAYGQPAHAFDYDAIGKHTMTLRTSKKGEKITTLDGKTHILPGNDIVIEDGKGRLIDLCGIMGGKNSSIQDTTTTIVLFLQTYDPVHIRKTSMKLAHRTEAAGLFEKGVNGELVLPAILKGIELIKEIAGGEFASSIYDLYPKPYKHYEVSVRRTKVDSYIGTGLADKEIASILTDLGFAPTVTKTDITVTVPSWRRDMEIDVDIIEEIARIYGYHRIAGRLPEGELPMTSPDPQLAWEEEIKVRLRDWGYTELYTYSMVSEERMDAFGQNKSKAYKITNPLSTEWTYMRPHLLMSVLEAVKTNLKTTKDMKVFELSMTYKYRAGDLPLETPTLIVVWTGHVFGEAKGLAEALFDIFGLDSQNLENTGKQSLSMYNKNRLSLGEFGSVGELHAEFLATLDIRTPLTLLHINFGTLTAHAKSTKKYIPIPRYPPIVEDLSFVVPEGSTVGPLIAALKAAHPLVSDVHIIDVHEDSRTVRITYQNPQKNLTSEEIVPIREMLIHLAKDKFRLTPKTPA